MPSWSPSRCSSSSSEPWSSVASSPTRRARTYVSEPGSQSVLDRPFFDQVSVIDLPTLRACLPACVLADCTHSLTCSLARPGGFPVGLAPPLSRRRLWELQWSCRRRGQGGQAGTNVVRGAFVWPRPPRGAGGHAYSSFPWSSLLGEFRQPSYQVTTLQVCVWSLRTAAREQPGAFCLRS